MSLPEISVHRRNDAEYEQHFNRLVGEVFGFSFDHWFRLGVWDDSYESYGLWLDGRLAAHAAVFKMDLRLPTGVRPVLQFSAVATHPDYRRRGLMRLLFEEIFRRYPRTPALLFANQAVMDFYPRFGFLPAADRIAVADRTLDHAGSTAVSAPELCRSIVEHSPRTRPLDCVNGSAIRLFHLYGDCSDRLYRLEQLQAVAVLHAEGETLKVTDLFAPARVRWADIEACLPFRNIRRIEFGFDPGGLLDGWRWEEPSEPSRMFVRNLPDLPADFCLPAFVRT